MSRTARRGWAPPRPRHEPDLPFTISSHAVDQLRERCMPALTHGRCSVEARILARSAKRSAMRTGNGCEIWLATDGAPIRFLVRNEDGRRTCVTVLPPLQPGEEPGEEVA